MLVGPIWQSFRNMIMKILGIPNSIFYRYKSRIYKEEKELLSKIMIQPLESRMLRTYETLEECCRINRQIAMDEKKQNQWIE
jgi:hypothetical protein